MNQNIDVHRVLAQLHRDRNDCQARRDKLRTVIGALDGVIALEHPRAPKNKRTKPVPDRDALSRLGTCDRILHVMQTNPAQDWPIHKLADATLVPSFTSLETELDHLLNDGMIVKISDRTWRLATPAVSAQHR